LLPGQANILRAGTDPKKHDCLGPGGLGGVGAGTGSSFRAMDLQKLWTIDRGRKKNSRAEGGQKKKRSTPSGMGAPGGAQKTGGRSFRKNGSGPNKKGKFTSGGGTKNFFKRVHPPASDFHVSSEAVGEKENHGGLTRFRESREPTTRFLSPINPRGAGGPHFVFYFFRGGTAFGRDYFPTNTKNKKNPVPENHRGRIKESNWGGRRIAAEGVGGGGGG